MKIDPVFRYLEGHPTQNMFARELVGDIIPHIVIARTKDELVDTSVIQLTNTGLPVIGGYTLNLVLNDIQKCIRPLKTVSQRNWFYLGKSMAVYAFIGSLPIANAFIRNWVTAKRTNMSGFIDMVGEKTTLRNKQELDSKIQKYEKNIASIVGVGLLSAGVIMALTQIPVIGKWRFGKTAQTISNYLALPRGNFEFFAKPKKTIGSIALPPILIWGVPIYAGLFSASRDQFEFKELVLRFGTFITSFFILPKLVKNVVQKSTPNLLKRVMGNNRNAAIVAELITTSVMFAILPPLINIYLTHQRAKKFS